MNTRRRLHRLMRAALAVVAVVSVLASAALAGQRYFYCAMMDEVSLEACCAGAADGSRDDDATIDDEACCTSSRFAATAPGTVAAGEPLVRAPLVAIVPAPPPIAPPVLGVRPPARRVARAGPDEPSPREHRLRSMVFLT